jgi:hypothetical protein
LYFTYLKLNGLFRKRLPLKEILLRRKDVRKTKAAEGLIANYINQQKKRCIVKVVKQKENEN